jgi:hypothetical protein
MRPLVEGYEQLRLRIDRRQGGLYHVFASTRSAEASATFELPFSELEIENFILRVSRPRGRRRIDSSAIGEARRFGGGLFKALFSGEVHALYRDALAQARGQERGVRITLCLSESPELIDVPWEYLFDDPDFLAVSAFTPVVRYLDLPRSHRPLLVEPPLRLLGIVSSPTDYEQLDAEREHDNLERALSGLSDSGAVELHWLERPTLGALLRVLQTQTFHALHYVGHGTYDRDADQGVLLFEDDSGWARPVSGDKLGMILHDFSSLRLTVLNACEGARSARTDPFAGVAGSLVQRDIPAVVAMQFEISDEAAIVFAGGFYQPLAAGFPVDASLSAARLAMLAERSDDIEWGTPVLFMRVPDGRIFDFGDQREPPAPTPEPTTTTGRRSNGRSAESRGSDVIDRPVPMVDDASGRRSSAGTVRAAPVPIRFRRAAVAAALAIGIAGAAVVGVVTGSSGSTGSQRAKPNAAGSATSNTSAPLIRVLEQAISSRSRGIQRMETAHTGHDQAVAAQTISRAYMTAVHQIDELTPLARNTAVARSLRQELNASAAAYKRLADAAAAENRSRYAAAVAQITSDERQLQTLSSTLAG